MKKIALFITKRILSVLKIMNKGGSFPGSIMLKINPSFFQQIQYNCPILIVTGTNGKTSTSNMIANLFSYENITVIHNKKGDNLKEGIATLFIQDLNYSYSFCSQQIVLEVDELSLPYLMQYLPVQEIVVTNFFRDQLDRAQEMEQVISKIEKALQDYKGTLILNGNDPNVTRLAYTSKQANCIFYGVEACEISKSTTTEASEGKFCPLCNCSLNYEYYQYSHIGKFKCSNCGFHTNINRFLATNIDVNENKFQFENVTYKAPLNSLYSMYNCMATLVVAKNHNMKSSTIQNAFTYTIQPSGRNERFFMNGKHYTLNLVKNPTGTNEVLKMIHKEEKKLAILIVLNDNAQDGKDVSWIYDAQFEYLVQNHIHTIICSGIRRYDMAVRMKYCGYENNLLVIDGYQDALQKLYEFEEDGYIITTYTGLQPIYQLLRKDMKSYE